jgi:flavoprotein
MPADPHTGPFKVMRSQGSGLYYVGTMLLACGDKGCEDCQEYRPGTVLEKGQELDYNSRETDYFKTKQEADDALKTYNETKKLPNARY